ncbi:MAG: SpoVA/SpoVAEb family sporulation membrane protein [Lachnospiraceae bacterium]
MEQGQSGRDKKEYGQQESQQEAEKQRYNEYITQITPTFPSFPNVLRAFLGGGIVCTISQALTSWFIYLGWDKDIAASWSMLILVAVAVLLTGFNLFSKLAKFFGAGVLVPITGFANSVASPAIEYRSEGWVFGVGCKIFTIAGPVILYGVVTSWGLGFIYWILKIVGIM